MGNLRMTDKQIAKKYGKRNLPEGAVAFDQPQELGYICPMGHGGDWLAWSEFNEHIWCYKCERDYHYALDCQMKRICWMSDEQWDSFYSSLPMKPKLLDGIQHFPDCKIPHEEEGL